MKGHKQHHHKKGGRVGMVAAGNPDVLKEAEGKEPYAEGDEKKKGGRVKHKDVGHMAGAKSRHRLDRPGRKRGGRVGSDLSPLSTAHKGGEGGSKTPKSEDTYGGQPD